jgi:hypothetical protein
MALPEFASPDGAVVIAILSVESFDGRGSWPGKVSVALGGLVRVIVRWGVAIAVSLAVFALAWWTCQTKVGLDEGEALGVAGAALAIVLAVAAWWATRRIPDDSANGKTQVRQSIRAGTAYVVGKGTINIHRRPGE